MLLGISRPTAPRHAHNDPTLRTTRDGCRDPDTCTTRNCVGRFPLPDCVKKQMISIGWPMRLHVDVICKLKKNQCEFPECEFNGLPVELYLEISCNVKEDQSGFVEEECMNEVGVSRSASGVDRKHKITIVLGVLNDPTKPPAEGALPWDVKCDILDHPLRNKAKGGPSVIQKISAI